MTEIAERDGVLDLLPVADTFVVGISRCKSGFAGTRGDENQGGFSDLQMKRGTLSGCFAGEDEFVATIAAVVLQRRFYRSS